MRAIVVSRFGPPEVLVATEVDAPVAGDDETLVDVELASITFVETQVRAGRPPVAAMAPALPYVPGNGVAGTIGARRVITTTGGTGAYAERAAAPTSALIDVPDGVTLADALAVLADGRTALGLMDAADVRPGETVLVEAAAGGVGSLLVQLALGAGAQVVAAAGGARKLAIARELGAQAAVDYTREDWADGVPPVDVVFDGVGGAIGRAAFARLRAGGRQVPFGAASGAFAGVEADGGAVTIVRPERPSPKRSVQASRAALRLVADGLLRPLVGQTFPLERAADAHRAIESRATVGKTLLVVR